MAEDAKVENNHDPVSYIKRKMRKARAFYKKGKMGKKKYQTLIRKYREKLNELKAKEEEIPAQNVGAPLTQRSQLNFEDIYSEIGDDESWTEPLLETEFECDTRECEQCHHEVRVHWLVCPECRTDLQ